MRDILKIKMRDVTPLQDPEMKAVRGGYYGGSGSGDYNGGSGSGGSGYIRCFQCKNGHEGMIGARTMDAIWDLFAEHCPAGGGIWEC